MWRPESAVAGERGYFVGAVAVVAVSCACIGGARYLSGTGRCYCWRTRPEMTVVLMPRQPFCCFVREKRREEGVGVKHYFNAQRVVRGIRKRKGLAEKRSEGKTGRLRVEGKTEGREQEARDMVYARVSQGKMEW